MEKPTKNQIKILREKYSLTYELTSNMLGTPIATTTKWLTGANPMPVPSWRLLHILLGEDDPMTKLHYEVVA